MGGFANAITQPFGVKLFKGGPYADAGAGDKAERTNDEQMRLAREYMAKIMPLVAQIAQSSGVANPLDPNSQSQFANNPYGLSPLQQAESNRQASITSEAYDNILSKVRANLSARGMADSSTMTAAEAYLQKQLQGDLGSQRIQAGQNAYGNRMMAMDQIANLLAGAYGQQQNALGQRQNVYNYQGQVAQQSQQQAYQNLGQLLGLGAYFGGVGRQGTSTTGGTVGNQTGQSLFNGQPTQGNIRLQQGYDPAKLGQINWGSIYGG